MRGGEFLLALVVVRIAAGLQSAAASQSSYLLRIRRWTGALAMRSGGAVFLFPLTRLEMLAIPMSAMMATKRDDDRHTLPHRRLRLRLLGNGRGRILIRFRHGYFLSPVR